MAIPPRAFCVSVTPTLSAGSSSASATRAVADLHARIRNVSMPAYCSEPACPSARRGFERGGAASPSNDVPRLPRTDGGKEQRIVESDLADIDSCDAVLAAFTPPAGTLS